MVMVGTALQNQAETLKLARMLDGIAMVSEKPTQRPQIVPIALLLRTNTRQPKQERQRFAVTVSPVDVDEETRPAPRSYEGLLTGALSPTNGSDILVPFETSFPSRGSPPDCLHSN